MDRRSRAQQWRRARHNYNDLCPPIGRRAATALLWLSCSIALLRALATSTARAQQRAAQQRRSFLNAHHRSSAQVVPQPPESDSELEHEHEEAEPEPEPEPALPECFQEESDYESETESETESDIESQTETETAPTTEPETEPEDERGPPLPIIPKGPSFGQSLTERLNALRLRSPDASPNRAQPNTREPQSPTEGEEPKPEDKDPRDPEESAEPKREEKKKQRGCKPKKPTRRDPSPESPPPKRGPIPIRRH
ncbi:neuroendocrine secretory protein 55-like [Erinaceus europaeus]|uniref:Neuroendocrine secretory protein 55-like n=1 Tax=Erinaceus europaeus TaxID=9365 RepID=A0ABM3WRZ3_ERIEU|nr:neuroendocrine secretory protein 55-like [Erinaceus europaeus]XP_060039333.1 neuroendocrine secretory protein 55-like [Erinaceus europaeus]XP_060039377.1 neuroendocrine secretory protein 55-like [Erinaceus europaeus]